MSKSLKYFGLFFLAHVIFLVGYVVAHPGGDIFTDTIVFFYYLWPLLLLPIGGGSSHGGELFLAPVGIFLNSLVLAYVLNSIRRIRS